MALVLNRSPDFTTGVAAASATVFLASVVLNLYRDGGMLALFNIIHACIPEQKEETE